MSEFMCDNLEVEVVIWDPAGFGTSSFGHVSVGVHEGSDSQSFSLAPGGCDIRPFKEYIAKQTFRNGYGLVLELKPRQTLKVAQWFRHQMTCEYHFVGTSQDTVYNCASPIQRALKRAGVPFEGFALMPRGLGIALWNRKLVRRVIKYAGKDAQERVVHAPWVTSSQAYPWSASP